MTEVELINEIIEGDKNAFDKLFEEYKNYSYKISYHVLNNEDDALDNVNNAWIKIYKALIENKFKFESKFSTWIYRIILNEALMMLKTQKKEISLDDGYFDQTQIIDIRSYSDNIEDKNEKEQRLNEIMKRLNPRQQKIVKMLIEGYKFKEIAEKLEIKPNHLYQLTSRIKNVVDSLKKM